MHDPSQTPLSPQAGAPAFAPVELDAVALARLRELDPQGTNGLMGKLVAAFQTSLARLLPQLEPAQGALEMSVLHHVAHTLKSSANSVGGLALGQTCLEIEQQIRAGTLQNPAEHARRLKQEALGVLDALQRLLPKPI
jgi:HPt (histidine-containing phosphotransfer) domain-containing protein